VHVTAGSGTATESRLTPQDIQQPTAPQIKEDLTTASVKPDNVTKPSFIGEVLRNFTSVTNVSPLKNFDSNTDELPAKGYSLSVRTIYAYNLIFSVSLFAVISVIFRKFLCFVKLVNHNYIT